MHAAKIAGNDELMFLLVVEKCGGAFFIQSLKNCLRAQIFHKPSTRS